VEEDKIFLVAKSKTPKVPLLTVEGTEENELQNN
jgi:hypothetical protein